MRWDDHGLNLSFHAAALQRHRRVVVLAAQSIGMTDEVIR